MKMSIRVFQAEGRQGPQAVCLRECLGACREPRDLRCARSASGQGMTAEDAGTADRRPFQRIRRGKAVCPVRIRIWGPGIGQRAGNALFGIAVLAAAGQERSLFPGVTRRRKAGRSRGGQGGGGHAHASVCAVPRGFFPTAGRNRRPGTGTSGRGIYAEPWQIRSRRGGCDGPPCCGCIF